MTNDNEYQVMDEATSLDARKIEYLADWNPNISLTPEQALEFGAELVKKVQDRGNKAGVLVIVLEQDAEADEGWGRWYDFHVTSGLKCSDLLSLVELYKQRVISWMMPGLWDDD